MRNPIPAQITQLKTMSKTVRITVDTQETLTQDQKAELFDLYDSVGYFFFFPKAAQRMEVDTSKLAPIALEEGERSPGQRLRGAFFVYWDKNVRGRKNDPYAADFDLYYRREMDKIIDQVKERLT